MVDFDYTGLELVDVPEGAPEALREMREAGGYDYPEALDWSGLELVETDAPPTGTETAPAAPGEGPGREVSETTTLGEIGEIPAGVAAGAVGTAGTALQGVSAAFPPARDDIPEDRKAALRGKMREAEDALMRGDVDAYSRLTREIHAEALVPVTRRAGFQAGQRVRDWGQRTFPATEGYEDSFGRQVGEGVGSLVTGIAASAVHPGAATVLFTTLGMGESADRAAQSLAEKHGQEAVDRGEYDEQIARATLLGVGPGMTDQIPVEILLKRLPVPGARAVGQAIRSFGGQRVMRALGRIGSQAVIEAVQEGGQQTLQNLIARHVHTPETEITEGVLPSAAVGGAVGTIAGVGREAVINLAGRRSRSAKGVRAKAAEEVPPPSPEDEASPIPTETIDEGRRVIADAEGVKVANEILAAEGMPEIATPVRVGIGRKSYEGVVTDAWGAGPDAGITVTEADGTVIDSELRELHGVGAEIEILPPEYVEGDPRLAEIADRARREAARREAEAVPPEIADQDRHISEIAAGAAPSADVETTAGTEADTGGWTPPANLPSLSPRQADAVADLVRGGMDADRAVAVAAAMPAGDVETTAPVATETVPRPAVDAPAAAEDAAGGAAVRPPQAPPTPAPETLPEGDVETTAPVESDLEIVEMAPEQGRPEEAARPDVPIPAPAGEPTTLTGRPISEYGPVRDLASETMVDETVETEAPVETPAEAAPAAPAETAMERLARRQTQLRVSRMSPDEAREHLDALRLAGRNVEGIEIPSGRPEPDTEAAEPGDVDEMGPVESPDLPPGWSMHRRSDGKYVANNARWRMPARDTAEEAVDAAVEQEATGERFAAARARAEAEGLTGQDALRRVAEIMEGQPARGEVTSDSGDAVAPVTASDQDERRPSAPPGEAVGISGQEPTQPPGESAESTPSPGQPGRELVLRKDGEPFKTARAAELVARSKLKAGRIGDDYMVVDHAGGFAIEVAAQGEQDGQETGPVPAGREAGRDVPSDGEGAGPVGPGRAEAGPVEPVDAGAEPEIRAGTGVPAALGVGTGGGVAPEIVVRKNGEPFKGIGSARAAAKAAGVENFRTVRVDGGYGYEVTEESPAVTRAREDAAEDRAGPPRNQVPGAAPSRPVREVDRPARVITPAGRRVEVQPIVIEARDLIASHDEAGRENPTFPSEFQPRDRSRAASQEQIASMAGELIPELLMPSPQSSEGAPVVGPDRVVESGNARTLALRRAYEMNLADDYRNHLIERGYDIEGFDQPVLVQQRVTAMTPEERAEFAREANARTTADRGASEVAKSDAASIDRSLLDFYEPGDVASAGNREFVRQFIASVVPEMERAGMMAADGTLSQAGKQRIENALFDAAYDDAELLGALREDIDSNVKSLGGAMLDAAPEWARMRRGVQDGSVEPMVDQTEHILSAVRMVRKARSEGVKLAELVRQDEMLAGDALHPLAEDWLRSMYADPAKLVRPYGRQRLAEGLVFWATEAQKKTAGENLFGETLDADEIARMMELTRKKIARAEGAGDAETEAQPDLLGGAPVEGAGPDTQGAGAAGAGQVPGDAAAPGRERGDQEGRGSSSGGLEESGLDDDFQPRQLSLFADGGSGAVPDGPAGAAAPDRPSREFRGIAKADVLALEDVRVGLTHVRLPEDAAHVAAPFRKEPQETALGIVLDRNDRLVGVVRHSIGTTNFTPVDVAHLAGAIAQVPGAQTFYLAHQHPSGKLEQSRGDAQMNRQIADLTRRTGLAYRGSVVIAPGQKGASFAAPDAGLGETKGIDVRPAARTRAVPVFRRRWARIPPKSTRVKVNTHERAKKTAERFLPEKSGVLLVDNDLNLLGVFAMDTAEMSRLRGKGGAARDLMSAMAESGANRMMILGRKEQGQSSQAAVDAIDNMRRFARTANTGEGSMAVAALLFDEAGEFVTSIDQDLDDRTFLQRGPAEPRTPVARLTGRELGREGIPLAILRGRARRWYRENLVEPGRTVVNENDGREIAFERAGARKTVVGGEELLRIVPAIPDILRRGRAVGAPEPDNKGRAGTTWHRYGGTVEVDGRPVNVLLTVRERPDGTFHYSLQHHAEVGAGVRPLGQGVTPEGTATSLDRAPGTAEDSIASPDDEIKFQRATPEEFAISTEARLQRARGDDRTGDLFGRDVKSQRPIDEGLFAQGVPKPEFTEEDEAPPPARPEKPQRETEGGEFDLFAATPPARQKPVEPSKAIEDFGEKIEGARKDLAAAVRDRLTRAADIDIASAPLSESFPQLDYAKMAEAGMDRRRLALYAVLRSTVPNKPRRTYKLRRWVNDVEVVRDMARQAMDEDSDIGRIEDTVGEQYALTAEMLSGLDPELWVKAGKYRIGYGRMSRRDAEASRHMYFLHRKGRLYTEGDSENRAEAIEAARGIVRRELAAEAARPKTRSKLTKINVYQDRRTKDIFLGFKGNRQVVRLKTGFANASEAREYLAANREDLQVKIDELRKGPSMRRDTNRDREGKPRREGDVTPQLFTDMFGFRGVQFGNYVEGGRRQKDLNDSFDALMDLADAVDVPPKALALDGTLGLAFGARGRGGRSAAAAHYEPDQVVINLTKTAGPGSLAHEWLHALDNNFGTRAGGRFLTDTTRPGEGMRPEVAQAWRQVTEAIDRSEFSPRSREFDASRSKPYWSQPIEKAARAFERYVHDRLAFQGFENDYLVNIDLTGGAYPTAEEMRDDGIAEAFDRLFDAIESRETPRGVELFQRDGDGEPQADARVRIRPTKRFDAERLAIRAEIESLGERAFGKGFNIRLADRILTPEGDQATGAFDPAARIAYIALRDPADMTGTLHHEGLHYLRRAGAFTKQDGTPTASWKVLEAEAPRWREKFRIDERYPAGIGEDLLNEEAIAEAIDDYAKNKPPEIAGKVKLAMDRILAFWKRVGNAIRGRGFRTATDVFESIRSGDFAGPDGQTDPEAMDRYLQTAWHASPHVFGRFSTDFMGEGEGAQSFGWGLYFASRQEVTDFYREGLSRPALFVRGAEASELDWADSEYARDVLDELARQMSGGTSFEEAHRSVLGIVSAELVIRGDQRKYWRDQAENNRPRAAGSLSAAERSLEEAQRLEQGLRGLTSDDVTLGRTGATYRVALAPKENEYILWDAQMAAQPKPVRDALRSLGRGTREYLTGQEIYRSASRDLGSDRAASEALLAAGIRGIKYLDQGSRPMVGALGRARMPLSDTYNYVIFDDSDVAIEEILLQRRRLGDFETEPGAEGVDQAIIPGAEPLTEREVLERRMRGPATTEREQKPMDEGLWAPPEEEQMTLFQREMVATPEFRRWFGDSKAVDEQGNPEVVYHGGRLAGAEPAIPSVPGYGLFFTSDRDVAESYGRGDGVAPAFLKMDNPFRLEEFADMHPKPPWVIDWIEFWQGEGGWTNRQTGEEMGVDDVIDMIEYGGLPAYETDGFMERWHDFLANVREHHDGYIGRDPSDQVGRDIPEIFVAFSPEQVKSADNRGTFDPDNPDMRYQRVSAENREPFEEAATQQFGIDMKGAAGDVKTRKASLRKIGEDIGDQLLGPTRKGKAENIAVMDIEDPKDLNMLLRWLAPPGVWAKKYPRIHKVWRQGVKAEVDQSVYIKRLNREWDEVTRPLSKPEFEQLTGLMFLGDAEARAFTDAELDDFKVSDKVKTAYRGARRFIDKLGRWTEQHERNMKLDLLRQRSRLIREMAGLVGMEVSAFRERFRERAKLKALMRHGRGNPDRLAADIEDATQALFGELLENEDLRSRLDEADSLEARLENTNIRRRTGYVPHKFFGNWQIMAMKPDPKDPDQSIRGENPAGMGWEPVAGEHGNFPSRLAAIRAAREYAQDNPGAKLIVKMQEFAFPDSKATVLTDQAMRTLRDRVRKLMEVDGEELDAVLEGVARPRNRRRFAGFEEYREGMPGFNKNLDRVIRAHIGETVRYTTLDRLKYDAITAMEKEGLQRSRVTQERPELQKAVEAFLRDVNGQKQPVEQQVDQILNRKWAQPLRVGLAAGGAAFLAAGGATTSIVAGGLIGSYIGYRVTRSLARGGDFPSRAVTAGMLSDMSHLKLGMVTNIMSAVVNLTQTGLNTYPVLGFRDTSAGIKRLSAAIASNARGKPNNDWKILVKNDVNPTFGFGEGTKNQFQKEPALSKLSMLAFTSAEGFNRSVAFLGAVNKAERQGRSWGQAVQEGKRTMERTQFHYGPANKPELLRGNFLRVPLQFKNFVAQQMTFALGVRGKEIPRFLLSLFLVAGALGLPGLDALDWLLEVVTDGDFSPIAAIKEGALELAAKGEIEGGLGQLIARGVPGALGVEISGRTGMGEKFLPLQIRDFSGPWFSTVKNAARHAQERTGVIDQIRNLSPGLGNPLRALEAAGAGGQMTSPWKRGRPEMIYTPGELVTKAIGGRPTREAMEQDWRDIYRRKAERARLGSRRYIDRAVRAVQINDRPELIRIMREAAEDGVPITGSQLRSAMRGMMTQRAERTLRTLPKSLRGEARQLRRGLDRAAPR